MADRMLTLVLRNRYLLGLAIVVSLVAGVSALWTIPRLEDPRIVNRGPIIITPFPGASAERVESLVTDPIETALDEIDEIKTIRSTSRAGVSIVSVELLDSVSWGDNLPIFSEIRDQLRGVQATLPEGAGAPELDEKRGAVAFTLVVAVRAVDGGRVSAGMLSRLGAELADRFRGVAGTELVRVYGAADEEVRVEVDRDEVALLGLTAGDIARRIGLGDSKGAAGVVRGPASDVVVEVSGELETTERIAEVPLLETGESRVVRVGDIATVRRGVRTPTESVALADGRRSVLVAARMAPGAQAERWADDARRALATFRAERGGIEASVVFEQTRYTGERLAELGVKLLAGAGVIVLVIWLTMGVREAIVVASALPIVVSLTLMAIQMSGNSLHQMSIFGMIIALGLLIDNAIVVTDEVAARRRRGEAPAEAVAHAVRHLLGPLIASTLTTVFAFAPILLLPGSGGDFVGSIGQSVIYAVSISLVVSLTIIASLAGLCVDAGPGRARRWWLDGIDSERGAAALRRLFEALYRRPVAAIALAAVLPGFGFALAPTLGNQFFPPVDRDMLHVQIWSPSGSSLAASQRRAEAAERVIRSFEGVERVHWLVGGSFPSVWYNLIMDKDSTPSYAHGIVDTESARATKRLIPLLQAALDEAAPGAQIVVRSFGQGPPVVADIEYRVIGADPLVLQEIGERFRARLQARPDVLHTRMTTERAQPKLSVEADERLARLAGLTLDDVAEQLASAYEGAVGGEVREDLETMPVRVSYREVTRGRLDEIASTTLTAGDGSPTPLPAIADVTLRPESGALSRYNGERSNTVQAFTRAGALPIDIGKAVLAELRADASLMPPGYRILEGGAAEQDADAVGNLMLYLPVLVTLTAATLILTFRSVLLALVLGCVAAMSVGLALLATWSMSFPVSFNTILGTLGLIGVALNDSVVVLAALRQHPTARLGDPAGLAEAVMGCLRHVVSTTLTTIGGFLPLLLFVGGDFWPSLAIVMAGGIGGATVLAVLFVPAAFRLVTLITNREAREAHAGVELPAPAAAPAA